ncbi:MAG TPA: LysM peptidoglycan-binding domain-containing M23 family metallopeptidase [Alphaproteobacteria bacterium]|nr:LysM peptidoglycan-binding domain-containing M23 family metallopeptidase [Alphaproteobacteria bacterium]
MKRGDTLFRIARRHAVRIERIIQLNGLKRPYRLRIGQRLRLRAAQTQHRVRRGDSVARIAKRYRVSRRGLIRLNNLKRPYRLKIGQKLQLPGRGPATKRTAKKHKPSLERARPVIRRRNARSPKGLEVRRKVAGAVLRGSGLGTKRSHGRVGKPPALSGRGFAWPLRGRVVGRFGTYPGGLRNDGVNIAARAGSIVRAAENGVVAYAGSGVEGFGELLLIKHAGSWMTAYAHNERFLVRRGQRVRRGQPIATVGSTGAVIRPQLHFEIRKSKRPIDPLAKLPRNRSLASR